MARPTRSRSPVCVVMGAGPGNGAAFARRFSSEGYSVALVARDPKRLSSLASEIEGARAFPCDVGDEKSIETTFKAIARDMGFVDVLIYNAGKGVWGDALSVAAQDFEAAWRVNAYGAFLSAQQILPSMIEAGTGSIIFVGATASRRGSADATAVVAAKAAQRSLAESLARAYGRNGVHVSLLVIDAVVGEPMMREKLRDRPDDFFCMPEDIAETVLMLVHQRPSAWTFEIDVRPFAESW